MNRYLILSVSRGMWWRPNSQGYTSDVHMAGLYEPSEALDICNSANHHLKLDSPLEEVMVPAGDVYALFEERQSRKT